ncbi:MAG: EamA family transporter RarD [Myxococcaceae bacterium]
MSVSPTPTSQSFRAGLGYGIAAYLMWGLFPLYWPLLKTSGEVSPAQAWNVSLEILSHRVVWSLGVVVVMLAVVGKLRWFKTTEPSRLRALVLAAALVSFNWLLYIWAVNTGHVVETALGYFINPLVSVLLGVFMLGERLRRAQWLVLGGALVGVLVLAFDMGRPPWIALGLAPSFGLYGLVKKRAGIGAVESLSFETAVLFPFALGWLVWLELSGTGRFAHASPTLNALFVGAGVLTAIPLVCFGAAANRIPLSMVGLLQYIAPSLQFLCGVVLFHEAMSPGRWLGFGVLWASLGLFIAEGLWVQAKTKKVSPST